MEDWPVTRLAFDIFYGYRVISAYFLSRALLSNEPSHSDENFADERDFLFCFFFYFFFALNIADIFMRISMQEYR